MFLRKTKQLKKKIILVFGKEWVPERRFKNHEFCEAGAWSKTKLFYRYENLFLSSAKEMINFSFTIVLVSLEQIFEQKLKFLNIKGNLHNSTPEGGDGTTAPPFDFNSINWKNGAQNMITYAETKNKSIFWKNCTLYRENKNQIKTHFRWKKQEISLKIKLQGAPTCGFG